MDVGHRLNGIDFVRDSRKASFNVRKHGVAFETACEIFFDPFVTFVGTEVVGGEELGGRNRDGPRLETVESRICLQSRVYPPHLGAYSHDS